MNSTLAVFFLMLWFALFIVSEFALALVALSAALLFVGRHMDTNDNVG
jgi:hypothetical protein